MHQHKRGGFKSDLGMNICPEWQLLSRPRIVNMGRQYDFAKDSKPENEKLEILDPTEGLNVTGATRKTMMFSKM